MEGMQGDGHSVRYADIELIQNGQTYIVDPEEVYVDIMGTKPDTKQIWNTCEITEEGHILVEITQQMLAVEGRGDYVIVIINKRHNQQVKSFPFMLITTKAPYDASYIESTDEFQRLVAAITDGSKSAEEAKESAAKALVSETNAKASEDAAKISENLANDYQNLSKSYAVGTDGVVREGDATDNSKYYSEQAHSFMDTTEIYKDNSKDYADASKSYAVGTNNTYREGDVTDNSKYYSEQSYNSAQTSQTILENVIYEGENAVNAIYEALDIVAPNFVMDIETGHLKWEGGRFTFEVDNRGHLMWKIGM